MSIILMSLSQLQQLASQSWYTLDMANAFSAGFNGADYNSGACNGGYKASQFLQAPYVTKGSNYVEVNNTGNSVNKNACIYQDTQDTCSFSVGGDGLT